MGKLGFFIPRTISTALSRDSDEPEPFHIRRSGEDVVTDVEQRLRRRPGWSRSGESLSLPQRVVRIGRSIIPSGHTSASSSRAPSRTRAPVALSAVGSISRREEPDAGGVALGEEDAQSVHEPQRTIRFMDEQQLGPKIGED
jgi:hypothetical protein